MARGVVLNPCWDNAAWLGASDDVTCCWSGGGGAGQVREPRLGDGWQRGRPGRRHHGAPPMRPGPAQPGRLRLPPSLSAPSSTSCPAEESWWSGLVIVIAVCCASLLFLTVLVIICYKAIKR